jgi:hypothetical protein
MKLKRWYLFTLVPKVASMESVPLCPNSNNQAICNGVYMSIVKGNPLFYLPFARRRIFHDVPKSTYAHSCGH